MIEIEDCLKEIRLAYSNGRHADLMADLLDEYTPALLGAKRVPSFSEGAGPMVDAQQKLCNGWCFYEGIFVMAIKGKPGNRAGRPSHFDSSGIYFTKSLTGGLNRIDGPAYISPEHVEWWIEGENMQFEQWLLQSPLPDAEKVLLKMRFG